MKKISKSLISLLFLVCIITTIITIGTVASAATDFFTESNWRNNGAGNVFEADEVKLQNSAFYKNPFDLSGVNSVKILANFSNLVPVNQGGGKATFVLMPSSSSNYPHWDWTTDAGLYFLITRNNSDGEKLAVSIGRHTGGGFVYYRQDETTVAGEGSAYSDLIPLDNVNKDVVISLTNTSAGTRIMIADQWIATVNLGFSGIFTSDTMYFSLGSWGAGVNVSLKGFYLQESDMPIEATPVNMDGVIFEETNLVYNGLEQEIRVSGTLPKGIVAEYEGNVRKDVGSYKAKVTFSSLDLRYTPQVSYKEIDFNVLPATLTVTADDKYVNIGNPMPSLTATYSGFVNDEDESVLTELPVLSCPGFDNGQVSSFDINVSGGSASNYTLSYVSGKLYVVTTPTITVTFNGNGATGGSMDNQTELENTSTALSSNRFVRDGYYFTGWATQSTATEPEFYDKQEFTFTADTELFAIWVLDERNDYIRPENWNKDNILSSDNSGITIGGETYCTTGIDGILNNVLKLKIDLKGLDVNGYVSFVLSSVAGNSNIDYTFFDGLYVKLVRINSEGEKLGIAVGIKNGDSWRTVVGTGSSAATVQPVLYDIDTTAETFDITFVNYSDRIKIYLGESVIETVANLSFKDISAENGCFYFATKGNYKLCNVTHPNEERLTVTFDTKGGTAVDAIGNLEANEIIAAPAAPEKEGFVFAGWVTEDDGNVLFDFENTPITENITLFAKWEVDSRPEYLKGKNWESQPGTAKPVENNGIVINKEAWCTYPVSTNDNNALKIELDLAKLGVNSSAGFCFSKAVGSSHWGYTINEGMYLSLRRVVIEGVEKTEIAFALKIGVGWETLIGIGGTPAATTGSVFDIDTQTQKVSVLLKSINQNLEIYVNDNLEYVRQGYTFAAASTKGNMYIAANRVGSGSFTLENVTHPNELRYKVEFDTLGGDPVNGIYDILPDSVVSKPSDPEKPGYRFDGWSVKSDEVELFDFDTKINQNYKLYAVWTEIDAEKFTVSFVTNCAQSVAPVSDIISGSKISAPAVVLEREGYSFTGWSITAGGQSQFDFANTK
ncbi:MAG: InlB B-repeat-containing protein, partial [Christensenellales bacterium]